MIVTILTYSQKFAKSCCGYYAPCTWEAAVWSRSGCVWWSAAECCPQSYMGHLIGQGGCSCTHQSHPFLERFQKRLMCTAIWNNLLLLISTFYFSRAVFVVLYCDLFYKLKVNALWCSCSMKLYFSFVNFKLSLHSIDKHNSVCLCFTLTLSTHTFFKSNNRCFWDININFAWFTFRM